MHASPPKTKIPLYSWRPSKAADCDKLFQEKASGGRRDRPQLQKLLGQLRPDDVVAFKQSISTSVIVSERPTPIVVSA